MRLKARSAGGLRRIPGTAPRPRRPFAGGIGAAPSPGGVDAHPWRSAPPRPVPERAGAPAGVPLRPLIRGPAPGGGAPPAGSPRGGARLTSLPGEPLGGYPSGRRLQRSSPFPVCLGFFGEPMLTEEQKIPLPSNGYLLH